MRYNEKRSQWTQSLNSPLDRHELEVRMRNPDATQAALNSERTTGLGQELAARGLGEDATEGEGSLENLEASNQRQWEAP